MSFLFLLILSSCSTLSPSFVTTVKDHRSITTETNTAMINTITDECASETDEENLRACDDLIERFHVISRQAVAIEKYVMNELTEEELALFIRSKWGAQ